MPGQRTPPKYFVGAAALICLLAIATLTLASRFEPVVPQPVAFPHRTHVANQIGCQYCHATADRSIAAGIPSVTECMTCHESVKSESAEVKKLAAFASRNEEVPWVRIYGFPAEAAVYFTHKRHIKAGVACEVCHGNVGAAMAMRREVKWTMGKCIDCHRSEKVSVDCITCHK